MLYGIFYNDTLVTAVVGNGEKPEAVFNHNLTFMNKYLVAKLRKDGYPAKISDVFIQDEIMTMTCNITGVMRTVSMKQLPTVLELNEKLNEIL
jgi:hypothetical protein